MPVTARSPGQSLRRGMAFCPEDRKAEGIFAELSVRDNIVLGLQTKRGWLSRLSDAEQDRLAEEMIKALGIATPDADKPSRAALREEAISRKARTPRRSCWFRVRVFLSSTSRRAASTSARHAEGRDSWFRNLSLAKASRCWWRHPSSDELVAVSDPDRGAARSEDGR